MTGNPAVPLDRIDELGRDPRRHENAGERRLRLARDGDPGAEGQASHGST